MSVLVYIENWDGKFKKANKFLFANMLSCYDPAFFKTYEIFKYRKGEIKKKLDQKHRNREYVLSWDLREALHHEKIKFEAKFRDAKILITNQVRWRKIFLRDLKERIK